MSTIVPINLIPYRNRVVISVVYRGWKGREIKMFSKNTENSFSKKKKTRTPVSVDRGGCGRRDLVAGGRRVVGYRGHGPRWRVDGIAALALWILAGHCRTGGQGQQHPSGREHDDCCSATIGCSPLARHRTTTRFHKTSSSPLCDSWGGHIAMTLSFTAIAVVITAGETVTILPYRQAVQCSTVPRR